MGMFGASRRFLSSLLFAILFILVGIIIASMLDLPDSPNAREYPQLISQPVVQRADDFSTPFINVVAIARDAVVNINAESEGNLGGVDDYFRFFGLNHPRTQRSFGTGFIFRDDGYILTNSHVIDGAEKVTVTLSEDISYNAHVVGTDPATDLAVLKIDPKDDLPVIPFGHSDKLEIGEWVVAIGNPFPRQGLDRTVTAGVVSAKGRKNLRFADGNVIYQNYIQTDASINPGNSGGPLLNLRGEAIGVNAAISSPTGSSVGIGFAIPIDFARAVVPDLIEHGQVSRGWLGVSDLRDVPREMIEELDIPGQAITFDKVLRGSPAAKAGLKPRDIIYSFNGREIEDAENFRFQVATTPADQKVRMDVMRNGRMLVIDAVIGNRSQALQEMQSPRQLPYSDDYWLGMKVSECTPELAYKLGVDCAPQGGVITTEVIPGSPAYNRNIVPGVIIVEIDKFEINDLNDYREAVLSLRNNQKPISFIIYDTEGNTRWVGITPGR
ncbi:MAG: PDZ domain-containing protein [FCB group bacterium]|nr:PDZ domain-containing protein [FCB group bacterium]